MTGVEGAVEEGEGAGRGPQCFSKACVTRQLPSDKDAAETCAIGLSTASTARWRPERAAKRAVEASNVLLGKYRSEVEMAVQHALALGLHGAEYRLLADAGSSTPASHQLAKGHPSLVATSSKPTCAGKPSRPRGRRRAAGAMSDGGAAGATAACAYLGISIPSDRLLGFRALLARLKKRAFRAESQLIQWR